MTHIKNKACYFQGCANLPETKEHIPPKSFFPSDERNQLLTVPSCKQHNNDKSQNDLYALAQICLNASPKNRARDVFEKTILPQLNFNDEAFRKLITKNSVLCDHGAVKYEVDIKRLNDFFDALSCGVLYHISREQLPSGYKISHIYHNLDYMDGYNKIFDEIIKSLVENKDIQTLDFGNLNTKNEHIYKTQIIGIPNYQASITIVHTFFGHFNVTSLITV